MAERDTRSKEEMVKTTWKSRALRLSVCEVFKFVFIGMMSFKTVHPHPPLTASALLDWGFANYGVFEHAPGVLEPMRVLGGVEDNVKIAYEPFSLVVEKGRGGKIQYKTELPESISAPINKGDKVGEVIFTLDGKEIGRRDICATEGVERLGFFGIWWRMLGKFLLK